MLGFEESGKEHFQAKGIHVFSASTLPLALSFRTQLYKRLEEFFTPFNGIVLTLLFI